MYYKLKQFLAGSMLHLFLLAVAISCVMPLAWMVSSSLKSEQEFRQDHGLELPKEIHFSNYKESFFEGKLGRALFNSFAYTLITVFSIVIISSLAAYSFSRLDFPFKNVIFFVFLAAMMIPVPAGFVPVYVLLNKLHMANPTGYVLSMVNMGLSLSIYMLKTFFDQLPKDLEDAARIDGCGKLRTWRHVALPLVGPALGVTIIFNSLNVWNEFVLASLLFTDDKLMPLQVKLLEFTSGNVIQHTLLMASLTIAVLPIIILYLIMQKQIIKGITAGALVG